MNFLYLSFWIAVLAYVRGKKHGKEWQYALLSIPASFIFYFLVFQIVGKLAT